MRTASLPTRIYPGIYTCVAVLFLGGFVTLPSSATDVEYAKRKSKSVALPYGQSFTISGKTTDIQLTGGSLNSLMVPTTVGGKFTLENGQDTAMASSSITGDAWSVTIGALKADSSVTFHFEFSGKLAPEVGASILKDLAGDPAFTQAMAQFVQSATGKSSAVQLTAAATLTQAVANVVIAQLKKKGLSLKTPEDLTTKLSGAILNGFEPFFNMTEEVLELKKPGFHISAALAMSADDFSKLSIQELYQKLKNLKDDDFKKIVVPGALAGSDAITQAEARKEVTKFISNYEANVANFNTTLKSAVFIASTDLVVAGDSTTAAIVEDLKKYAGFDVGALYSFRLSELRSFAMVNIYFLGPVELKTEKREGKGFLPQRLSLAFGIALKDISGGETSKTKIKDQNAFVYGFGLRLNKYFRLTAGGLLYRAGFPAASNNPAANTLRHEFFIGPSIDVTALPGLQSIFSKSKSN